MKSIGNANLRKWGIGSLSPLICAFSVMFAFTYSNDVSMGQKIVEFFALGIPKELIAAVLFGVAILLGHRYSDDYGARAGKVASIAFLVVLVVLAASNWLTK